MNPRDRRAILWGLAVLVGAGITLKGIPAAIGAIRLLKERTAEQVETLARVEDVVMRGQLVRDSMTDVFRSIVALAPDLVDGEGSADAQASLTALLSLMANRHSVKVVRLDPLPDSAGRTFHQVAVHAELEGDVAGITGFLDAVETGDPILTASDLSLETPDPGSRPRMSEVLHLSLSVGGYYLPRTK